MKKIMFLLVLLLASIGVFAQDTIPLTVNYVTGEGVGTFLKDNAWAIGLFAIAIIDHCLGKSQSIKPNSLLDSIFALIKAIFKKK